MEMATNHDELKLAAGIAFWLMLVVVVPLMLGLSLTYSLVAVLCSLAALPAWLSARRHQLDLMEIIHPVMFLYVVYFGVRTVYVLTAGVEDPFRPDFLDVLDRALLYVIAGVVALLVGYYSGLGDRLAACVRTPLDRSSPRPVMAMTAGLLVLGLLCRAWVYSEGSYARFLAGQREPPSGLLMAVDFGGWASYYGFVVAAAFVFHGDASRGFRWVVWTVVAPATFLLAFFGGAKTEITALALGVLIARHYLARPIGVATIVLFAVLLLCVFPIVNSYRTISETDLDLVPHQAASLIPEALEEQTGQTGFVDTTWRSFMARVPGIDALALVVKYTPEIQPFQWGRTMIIAPLIAFVPTALWPGKYDYINAVASGVDFGSTYFGINDNESGVAITQVGELYLNFGALGIPLGMFIIGVLCRAAYQWFIAHGRTPTGVLIYVFVYVHLIFIEGWFGSTYSNLLKHMMATSLIAWICLKLDSSAVMSSRRLAGAQ